ncbi:MAG TPA: hypothetical protein VKP03_01240 [Patescibacteria group bacterium]|nr:hypothetical protein [Patescibacteria group bacterium]
MTTIPPTSAKEKIPKTEKTSETKEDQKEKKAFEQEVLAERLEKSKKEKRAKVKQAGKQVSSAVAESEQVIDDPRAEELKDIEYILSEGLEDLYKSLPQNRREEFRQKGEKTAKAVQELLDKAKVKMSKVVKLITDWLKMIPGVNKFFLEQESKIKADKLLDYKKQKQEEL